MQNLLHCERPKPTLKIKPPAQLSLLPTPQPPVVNRLQPTPNRDKIAREPTSVRAKKSLAEAIDYDKLTPTQQAKWAAGMYGSIQLREDVRKPYYRIRWTDPDTKIQRSMKLGHTWDESIAKLKQLTSANQ